MNGLTLHCGAHSVSRDRVLNSVTPDNTDTHYPIAHGELLDRLGNVVSSANMRIKHEAHGLTHGDNRYFGLIELESDSDAAGHGTVVGIRNSHDKAFSAGLVLGSRVFVCDNLAFSGEVVLARKHTKNILAHGFAGLIERHSKINLSSKSHGLVQD